MNFITKYIHPPLRHPHLAIVKDEVVETIVKGNYAELSSAILSNEGCIVKYLVMTGGSSMAGRAGALITAVKKVDKDAQVIPVRDKELTNNFVGYFVVSKLNMQIKDWDSMTLGLDTALATRELANKGKAVEKAQAMDIANWKRRNQYNNIVKLNYNILEGVIPYSWQIEGINMIVKNKQCIYSAETGLGKTFTTIIAACNVAKRVLVICPPAIVEQWQDELEGKGLKTRTDFQKKALSIFGNPKEEIQFDIVSNSQLSKIVKFGAKLIGGKLVDNKEIVLPITNGKYKDLFNTKYDMVILDEAHEYKNSGNSRSPYIKGFLNLLRKSGTERVVGLTATPFVTRLEDFYGLYSNVMSHPIGELSLVEFQAVQDYSSNTIVGYDILKKAMDIKRYGTDDNLSDCTLMYVPEEVVYTERPELRVEINITFTAIEPTAELVKDIKQDIENSKTVIVNDKAINTALVRIRSTCSRHKKDFLKEKLNNSSKPIVVFSAYSDVLLSELNKHVDSGLLTGSIPKNKRKELIKKWREQQFLHLLCNKTVGGQGVDGMQFVTDTMIIAEPLYEIGILLQILGRIKRLNNKYKKVFYEFVYVKGFNLNGEYIAIEETMIANMAKKRTLMLESLNGKAEEDELIASIENSLVSQKQGLKRLLMQQKSALQNRLSCL